MDFLTPGRVGGWEHPPEIRWQLLDFLSGNEDEDEVPEDLATARLKFQELESKLIRVRKSRNYYRSAYLAQKADKKK